MKSELAVVVINKAKKTITVYNNCVEKVFEGDMRYYKADQWMKDIEGCEEDEPTR